ncbi:glycosyltransferase [Janthinobacterium sp. B9-8]|uniref:glycosyltransferase n=1 Tax=Janthinobacterium sp. B9-8 TaxID=1236179 RepID=UPI0018D24350|nr:glycosyltransferase family 2 protein [Janthinobacterium sp. B9-8]
MSILIPLFNAASTIERCLEGILSNDLGQVTQVVLVLDRCTDDSEQVARRFEARLAQFEVSLCIVSLPEFQAGKVAAILYGGQFLTAQTVLLLDADIVLAPSALAELFEFHSRSTAPFSSCLIYPLQEPGQRQTLSSHIVCNNRLYRQSVLQWVKNENSVANFPGGLHLIDFASYRELLVEGFLEDLSATYQVLSSGGSIPILPRVLAWEIERQTIRGLFLQRLRWTIGAIQHLPVQMRTARMQPTLKRRILVNSYHVMWEFQHYVIAVATFAAPFSGRLWPVMLLPLALYSLQIARSVYLTRNDYRNSLVGIALHCIVFPMVISAALLGSALLLLKTRRFFFDTSLLFRRD